MPERVISLVQLGGQLVELGRVLPGRVGLVAVALGVGAQLDPHLLLVVGRRRADDGLGVEVPAFAALRGAQRLGPLGAGRADRGEGVPAGHEDLLDLAGVQVGAAELDGADAAAVLGGQVADDIAGQRHGEPLRSGRALGHAASVSPGRRVVVGSGSVACQVAR